MSYVSSHEAPEHEPLRAGCLHLYEQGRYDLTNSCIHLWALPPLAARATPGRGPSPSHVSAPRHRALCPPRRHPRTSGALPAGASDRGDGHGLPRFVEQEFREFLTCGVLAHGFTRLRCADCTFERLVPFSCKRRGFCPSCGGRRMAERAAYLVDEVLPQVPVRQWVLTLPYRLRYRLAWKTVWRDGTSHLLFEPIEFMEKLAAIIPRPAVILVLYHGVLAPHARWRSHIVRYGRPAPDVNAREREASPRAAGTPGAGTWAALMRRVFDLDVLACPRCGGRLRLIATVEDPAVVGTILAHLGLLHPADLTIEGRDGLGPESPIEGARSRYSQYLRAPPAARSGR